MRLYLSSKRLGNNTDNLLNLIRKKSAHVAIVLNAEDHKLGKDRSKKVKSQKEIFESFGFTAEELDLRNYFGRKNDLEVLIDKFDVIWVRGGNIFTLKYAFDKSGFSSIIKKCLKKNDLVYVGESAGSVILGPTLVGLELVDDNSTVKEKVMNYSKFSKGLDIIDYVILPHYKSNHKESVLIEKVLSFYKENNIQFQTLKDGEVILIDNNTKKLIT